MPFDLRTPGRPFCDRANRSPNRPPFRKKTAVAHTEAMFDRSVAHIGLTDLRRFWGVVSLIWRRPVRHADGRIILTALGFQLARTGGCDPCAQLKSGLRAWAGATCRN